MTIDYEYDFGSTTALMITVVNYRIGYWAKEKVTILSRNNPYVFLCSQCGEKPAVSICLGRAGGGLAVRGLQQDPCMWGRYADGNMQFSQDGGLRLLRKQSVSESVHGRYGVGRTG